MSAMSAVSLPAPLPQLAATPAPWSTVGSVPTRFPSTLAATSAAALVAVASAQRRPAGCQRAAEVNKVPTSFESMADYLRRQENSQDFMNREGQWISRIVCPWCNGGSTGEKSLSIVYKENRLTSKCWRMKSCGKVQTFWDDATKQRKNWARGRSPPRSSRNADGAASTPKTTSLVGKGKYLDLTQEHREFLEKRGISELTWRRMKVCTKRTKKGDSIVFPYWEGEKLVAEKMRTLPKDFWSAPGGRRSLFGFDDVKGQKEVVITEGEIDKLSFDEAGIRCSCSVQNGAATGLTSEQVQLLGAAERLVLAVDGDKAGEDCARKLLEQLDSAEGRCYRVIWPEGCKDANEVLMKHGPEELRSLVDEAEPMTSDRKLLLNNLRLNTEETMNLVRQRVDGTMPLELVHGVKTGWDSLDHLLRLIPGETTVVTGTPGSGKSEFLLSLAVNLAHLHNYRTLIFAFETTSRNLSSQLYLKALKTCPKFLESKAQDTEQHYQQVMKWVDDHILVESEFQADDDASLEGILEIARNEATVGQLNTLIIDPYNFIERGEAGAGMIEHHFIGRLLQRLKKFAEDFRVHVIIVAHPTKASSWDGEKPSLYSIAGSSNWFNKMDNGIVIQRREMEDPEAPAKKTPTNQLQISVEKVRNRDAGQLGRTLLYFDKETRSYKDLQMCEAEFASPATPLTSSASFQRKELVAAADREEEFGEY